MTLQNCTRALIRRGLLAAAIALVPVAAAAQGLPGSDTHSGNGRVADAASGNAVERGTNESPGVTALPASAKQTPATQSSVATSPTAPPAQEAAPNAPPVDDAVALAKKSQNPISDLIAFPMLSNWNYGFGSDRRTQYVLNVQPVIPVALNERWNLITRVILPVTYTPFGVDDGQTGVGDTSLSLYLSPRTTSKLTWGIGPQFLLPTASDHSLGSEKWGAGPTAVALVTTGPWVVGALAGNVWSFAGHEDRRDVNSFLFQPFVNYNVPSARGFALVSAPIITADWKAPNDQRWLIPVGGGISQTFVAGTQPMNIGFQLYYNVARPDNAPNWNLRFMFNLLFPKK